MSELKADKKLKVKQIEVQDNHGQIGHNSNIALLIKETHQELSAMSQRHSDISFFETMKSSDYDELDNGFFAHIVLYGEGQTVAIVPKSTGGLEKSELDEKKPPKSGDYLKNECFIYFFNDYAIFLSSGVTNAQIKEYLTVLMRRSKAISEEQQILITDLADSNAVEKIRRYGVKQIKLKTMIDAGSWYASRQEEQDKSFVSKVTSSISKIMRTDLDLSDKEINSYEYELAINHRGVLETVERDPLIDPAVDLFNESHDDEDVKYEIVLNQGKGSIKAETLKLDLAVKISRKGNSLDVEHVKKECLEYKKDLLERGILNAS